MSTVFTVLAIFLFLGWITGYLFLDMGFEIHGLLILSGMSMTLKLIRDEITRVN